MAANSTPHPPLSESPNLDHVTAGVYIGPLRAYLDLPALRAVGITHILVVCQHCPLWPEGFTVQHLPVNDQEPLPPGVLAEGAAFIRAGVAAGQRVLVMCAAGISRSSTFVLAYLLDRGDDLQAAWRLLKRQHRMAYPALELWASLLAEFDTLYTLADVKAWLRGSSISATSPVPGVDHVTDGVYIGGLEAALYADYLREAGITHVLKLYFAEPYWPEDFTVCDNALPDGEFVPLEDLQRGVRFINEQTADHKVLVVCAAGISRSSTFVLAYLVERGDDLRDAWRLLKQQHPDAGPLPEMWNSSITHYDLPYTPEEALRWVWIPGAIDEDS